MIASAVRSLIVVILFHTLPATAWARCQTQLLHESPSPTAHGSSPMVVDGSRSIFLTPVKKSTVHLPPLMAENPPARPLQPLQPLTLSRKAEHGIPPQHSLSFTGKLRQGVLHYISMDSYTALGQLRMTRIGMVGNSSLQQSLLHHPTDPPARFLPTPVGVTAQKDKPTLVMHPMIILHSSATF